jgi:hypothetical protein
VVAIQISSQNARENKKDWPLNTEFNNPMMTNVGIFKANPSIDLDRMEEMDLAADAKLENDLSTTNGPCGEWCARSLRRKQRRN